MLIGVECYKSITAVWVYKVLKVFKKDSKRYKKIQTLVSS